MDRDSKIMFKSQLSGYNKSDVNRYILEMNGRFKETEGSLKDKLAELEGLIAKRDAELASVKEDSVSVSSELNGKLADAISASAEKERELLSANAENARLNSIIAELKASAANASGDSEEIKILTDRAAALEKENESLKSVITEQLAAISELEKKALLYDKLSVKIGDIMLDASNSAESVLCGAEKKASDIVAAAEIKAREITADAYRDAQNSTRSINEEIAASLQGCIAELVTSIEDIEQGTTSLLGNIGNRRKDIEARLEYYKHNISEMIDSKIDELKKYE